MLKNLFGAAMAATLISSPAHAVVSVGGFNFDDNAFVDSLTGSSGSYTVSGGTLSQVLTDIDAGTYAFSFDSGAFLDLAFVDNSAVNGTGNDIVLFELGGILDGWAVTINGTTLNYTSVSTGFNAGGFQLNAIGLNLDDFGIGSGGTVNNLRLGFPGPGLASTSLVGALNSSAPISGGVPEPTTWAMMLLGFGLMGASMRRRQKVSLRYA